MNATFAVVCLFLKEETMNKFCISSRLRGGGGNSR